VVLTSPPKHEKAAYVQYSESEEAGWYVAGTLGLPYWQDGSICLGVL